MAKGPERAADRLSALVAEVEAAAYARGKADARTEFLAVLEGAEEPAPEARRSKPPEKLPAGKARTSTSKRAPRGAVRALIERALRDRPGSTPPEILDAAATDGERLVKLTSVQVELYTGGRQGRYVSKEGRWSLAASTSEANDGAPEASESLAANVAAAAPTGDAPGENAEAREPETGGTQGRLGMNW